MQQLGPERGAGSGGVPLLRQDRDAHPERHGVQGVLHRRDQVPGQERHPGKWTFSAFCNSGLDFNQIYKISQEKSQKGPLNLIGNVQIQNH